MYWILIQNWWWLDVFRDFNSKTAEEIVQISTEARKNIVVISRVQTHCLTYTHYTTRLNMCEHGSQHTVKRNRKMHTSKLQFWIRTSDLDVKARGQDSLWTLNINWALNSISKVLHRSQRALKTCIVRGHLTWIL